MGYLHYVTGNPRVKIDFRKYQIEIFDSPGKWMSPSGLEQVRRRIVDITYRSCGKHPAKGLYVDTSLMKDKIIGICSRNGKDCAFNAMVCIGRYSGREILHTGPAYCRDENNGIVSLLFFFALQYFFLKNRLRTFYLTTITHVPKVFGLMAQCIDNVYPNEKQDAVPTREQIAIRNILADTYIREIEPEYQVCRTGSFVLKGFRRQKDGSMVPYPHTAENVPKHRKSAYNDRCLHLIDYERGDALIQVGEVGVKTYLKDGGRNILRTVKKG